MNEVKVDIVGVGKRGLAHLQVFSRISVVEIVGVFDININRSKSISKEWGIKAYSSYEEVLRDPCVDSVVIATPDPTHAELTIKALRVGKNVLCEIPMAYTYDEVKEIVKAVESSERIYLLGQEVRYWPIFRKVKELVKEGLLGDIFYAETEYLHNIEDLIRMTPWRRNQTTMLGGGPHAVDILQWILGDLIEVFAYSAKTIKTQLVEDFTVALYKSNEGAIGRVVVAYGIKRPYSLSIRVYGTKGSFEQDTYPWSRKSGTIFKEPDFNKGKKLVVGEEKVPVEVHGAADYLQALNFIRSILGLEKPLINVYEAAKLTNACIAALESSVKGKPVRIPKIEV